MRIRLRKIFCALGVVFLCCSTVAAAKTLEGIQVALREEGQIYNLEGSFLVQAPLPLVWEVISDYDHIAEFVSSMRTSKVKERKGHHLLIEQVGKGSFFIFSKKIHLLLQIEEKPLTKISFKDISGQDFESYEGSWNLQKTKTGVAVRYRVQATPKPSIPAFAMRKSFKKMAVSLLQEVRAEILRRLSSSTKDLSSFIW